jgi:hypothetical protein
MTKHIILTINFIILLGVIPANADTPSMKLIERAYSAGEIDYKTSLNNKLYSIFNKEKLAPEFISDTPNKKNDLTMLLLEANKNRNLLDESLKNIFNRPVVGLDSSQDDSEQPLYEEKTYITRSDRFKIHYCIEGSNAVDVPTNISDIPHYILDIENYIEQSILIIVDNYGFKNIPQDGVIGGDNRLDIYVMNLSNGILGYAAFDSGPKTDPYLVLENDMHLFEFFDPDDLFTGTPKDNTLKTTTAHELFHIIQFQYLNSDWYDENNSSNFLNVIFEKSKWWFEATAVWMQDKVYPQINDYVYYLGRNYDDQNNNGKWDMGEVIYNYNGTPSKLENYESGWFADINVPLDTFDSGGVHQYGSVIFAKFLSERYGDNIIKEIWENFDTKSTYPIIAIEQVVLSFQETFKKAFVEFHLANISKKYIEGAYYPPLEVRQFIDSDLWNNTNNSTGTVDVEYSDLLNDMSVDTYGSVSPNKDGRFTITFLKDPTRHSDIREGDDASLVNNYNYDILDATIILLKRRSNTNTYEIETHGVNNSTNPSFASKTIEVTNFAGDREYDNFFLLLINPTTQNNSNNDISYTLKFSFTPESDNGNCFIATATYGSDLEPEVKLLKQFRDKHLLTNEPGKAFVDLYYHYSPPLAKIISDHEELRNVSRTILHPLVYSVKYPIAATIICLLFLLSSTLLVVIKINKHSSLKK